MIEHCTYLVSLLLVIGCLGLIDRRFRLAFWYNRRATLLTVGIGLAVFIIWDIFGIGLHIFTHGNSQFVLPIRIFGIFPIEELLFLFLLCYQTLLLCVGAQTWLCERSVK